MKIPQPGQTRRDSSLSRPSLTRGRERKGEGLGDGVLGGGAFREEQVMGRGTFWDVREKKGESREGCFGIVLVRRILVRGAEEVRKKDLAMDK